MVQCFPGPKEQCNPVSITATEMPLKTVSKNSITFHFLHYKVSVLCSGVYIPGPEGQTWGILPLGLCCLGQGVLSQEKHLALYSEKYTQGYLLEHSLVLILIDETESPKSSLAAISGVRAVLPLS